MPEVPWRYPEGLTKTPAEMSGIVKAISVSYPFYRQRCPDRASQIATAACEAFLQYIPSVLQAHGFEDHMDVTLRDAQSARTRCNIQLRITQVRGNVSRELRPAQRIETRCRVLTELCMSTIPSLEIRSRYQRHQRLFRSRHRRGTHVSEGRQHRLDEPMDRADNTRGGIRAVRCK